METPCFTEQINEIAMSNNFKEICDIEVVKREYNTLADPEMFKVSFVVREHLQNRLRQGAAMCGKWLGENYGNR